MGTGAYLSRGGRSGRHAALRRLDDAGTRSARVPRRRRCLDAATQRRNYGCCCDAHRATHCRRGRETAKYRRSDAHPQSDAPTKALHLHRQRRTSGCTLAEGGCAWSPAVVRHAPNVSSSPICIQTSRAASDGGARPRADQTLHSDAPCLRNTTVPSQQGSDASRHPHSHAPTSTRTRRTTSRNAPTHGRAIAPCACHFFVVNEAAPGQFSQHEHRGRSRPLGPERLGPAGGGSGAAPRTTALWRCRAVKQCCV